eukprot:SAG31_NODE_4743_length_2986_cov_4.941808_3_plen_116_part_00
MIAKVLVICVVLMFIKDQEHIEYGPYTDDPLLMDLRDKLSHSASTCFTHAPLYVVIEWVGVRVVTVKDRWFRQLETEQICRFLEILYPLPPHSRSSSATAGATTARPIQCLQRTS